MKKAKQKLLVEQLDGKFTKISKLKNYTMVNEGWIYTIRKTLNMSLKQLGLKLGVSAQNVMQLQQHEQNRTISLNKLFEIAEVLDMQLVYAFVPKNDSLQKMIENRAYEVAKEIVLRTSHSMGLEDQQNRDERLKKAIKDRAEKIIQEVPKFLWD